MHISYSELSRLTGMSYRTIKTRLEAAGLSPVQIGEQGKAHLWDSEKALPVIYQAAGGACDIDCLDLNAERAREAKERADKLELQNAQRRGELVEAADMRQVIETALMQFRTSMTGLPSKLSAMVDDLDERRRMFTEADQIVRDALTDLHKRLTAI